MSAITPSSNLRLLKLPIELDNNNQLTFADINTQTSYFLSITHLEETDFTYQRKDSIIRYPAHIDSIIEYNYCMYQNENYTNKWFYAYIINMRYINDYMTEIEIATDVFQTWQFDIEYKQSFVEREHVSDDSIGLHTYPEGLETGEYVSTKLQPTLSNNKETCFCVAVSDFVTSGIVYSTLNELLPSGLYYIGLTTLQGVKDLIKSYDTVAKADAINSVFVIPKEFFSSWTNETGIDGEVSYTVRFNTSLENITINKVNYLANEYYPKNNKLLCYPYSFLQVSNHNGMIVNYKWENFNLLLNGNDYKFVLRGALCPSGSYQAYPADYNNILNNYDESITVAKYPIGGWNSDVYTNWLTQNGVNNSISIASGVISGVVGAGFSIATGGVGALAGGASAVMGGFQQVANAVNEKYQHSLIPDQAKGNTNVGDYSFTYGLTNLEFKRMSVKEEYARVIDKYFDMYGYKINLVKIPNIKSRPNWNYVKLINANIHGYIPQIDLNTIKELFNNGITLWHNPSTFLDYSQNNQIT